MENNDYKKDNKKLLEKQKNAILEGIKKYKLDKKEEPKEEKKSKKKKKKKKKNKKSHKKNKKKNVYMFDDEDGDDDDYNDSDISTDEEEKQIGDIYKPQFQYLKDLRNLLINDNENDDTKKSFYKRLDLFELIRKLYIYPQLIQPEHLFYWELCLACNENITMILLYFKYDPIEFKRQATKEVYHFWTDEFVSITSVWIGLHYCSTYVKDSVKPLSLASMVALLRLECIELKSLCIPDLFEQVAIHYEDKNTAHQEMKINNGIFSQLNNPLEDRLDLITIANSTVSEDQQYWIEELEKMMYDIMYDTLYPNKDEEDINDSEEDTNEVYPLYITDVVKSWTATLFRLDYVAKELFLDESYIDPNNINAFSILELYTQLVHWINIQLYYFQKNKLYHIQFDDDTYKTMQHTVDEYLEVPQEGSDINELRKTVFEYHLIGAKLYYYIHRHPDMFISYFNKNIYDLTIPGPSNVMNDTNKRYITDFLNLQYVDYTKIVDIFSNKAHFYHEIITLQIFHFYMKRYKIDNWNETYMLSNYKLSTHNHWQLLNEYKNNKKQYVRMPMIYFSFGMPFVNSYDYKTKQHKTFICDDPDHALKTWLWCVCHYHNNTLEDIIDLDMQTITCHFLSAYATDPENEYKMIQEWNSNKKIKYSPSQFSTPQLWQRYKRTLKYRIQNSIRFRNAERSITEYRNNLDKEKREKLKLDQPYKELKRQEKYADIQELKENEYILSMKKPTNVHIASHARDLNKKIKKVEKDNKYNKNNDTSIDDDLIKEYNNNNYQNHEQRQIVDIQIQKYENIKNLTFKDKNELTRLYKTKAEIEEKSYMSDIDDELFSSIDLNLLINNDTNNKKINNNISDNDTNKKSSLNDNGDNDTTKKSSVNDNDSNKNNNIGDNGDNHTIKNNNISDNNKLSKLSLLKQKFSSKLFNPNL